VHSLVRAAALAVASAIAWQALVWPATLHAEDAPHSPADTLELEDVEGRARFEAGRIAFIQRRFEDALEDFRRAYELTRRSQLLYNIGAAADRLRQDQAALQAYERFLDEVPDAPTRDEVESRITMLRMAVERSGRERAAAEREDDAGAGAGGGDGKSAQAGGTDHATDPPADGDAVVAQPVADDGTGTRTPPLEASGGRASGNAMRPIAYGLAAAAGVGLVLGTAFGLRARNLRNEAGCDGNLCPDETAAARYRDARSAGTLATLGFAVGGAALVGSVLLLILSGKRRAAAREASDVSIDATLGRHGGSLMAEVRW
jgi:tetratricopeptide (TPR) repeat protein